MPYTYHLKDANNHSTFFWHRLSFSVSLKVTVSWQRNGNNHLLESFLGHPIWLLKNRKKQNLLSVLYSNYMKVYSYYIFHIYVICFIVYLSHVYM